MSKPPARALPALPLAVLCALTMVSVVPAAAGASTGAPGVLMRRLLGSSVQHRPIYAYRMGDPWSPHKAVVIGQLHGDERAGVRVADAILRGRPVHGVDLWVIPTANPDGYAAHTRGNARGVDLNRNWPNHWARLSGEFYSGRAAMSEPETRALHSFLNAVRPQYLVSMHQPLYGVDTTDGGARNVAFRNRLVRYLHLPAKPFRCWSVCHGSMTGWLTRHQRGAGITVEFGPSPSSAYLHRTAPAGILRALGAGYGWSAAHNPHGKLGTVKRISVDGHYWVVLSAWAYDPDRTATRLRVRIVVAGTSTVVWRGYLNADRPRINAALGIRGVHGLLAQFTPLAGRHHYQVRISNVGPGTGPRVMPFAATG